MTYEDERPMVGSAYRPKSRRCCIVSVLSVTLGLILILAIAIPVGMKNAKGDEPLRGSAAVSPACAATAYPDTCRQSLAGSDGTPVGMLRAAMNASDTELQVLETRTTNPACLELLGEARELIARCYDASAIADPVMRNATCSDIQTLLSAAMTNVDTCKDTLTELQATESRTFPDASEKSIKLMSNSLALSNCICMHGDDVTKWINCVPDNFNLDLFFGGGRRRLMNAEVSATEIYEEALVPNWMDSATSRHLLARPPQYNVIVAKDGSGKYRTVGEAVAKAPESSKNRYIIYVKAGVYDEQIIIPKKVTNLMIVGDGIDQTIFTGKKSVMLMRGMTTFASGTLIVNGYGFIGKLFTVRNTAGAAGHQAVAMRASADKAAFYRVKFDSYQDTLYCHSFRQFYRDCIVSGTVDFMFGNANAVLQNCHIIAKKTTLQGQQNTYTAQGKTDRYMNTGLAFQDCNFDGTNDLKRNVAMYPTFLGRPWKAYSTCVLLRPTLQAHIDPKGWLPWNTTNFGLYTSYFAEYQGKGPGSDRRQRVRWSHEIKSAKIANEYQAASFINGAGWITKLDIPYTLRSV